MPKTTCSIEGCPSPAYNVRGWCSMHYQRWRKWGDPLMTTRIRNDDLARFWSKVDKAGPRPLHRPELGPCWLWLGAPDKDGYGRLVIKGRMRKAHRFAYELLIGAIPEGLEPDHLCRNPACVNPAHLEAVTPRENMRRGTAPSSINARKTHCIHGHEFTPENTYLTPEGARCCRECRSRREARYRALGLR